MDIGKAFAVLRDRLGSDRVCASFVGVSPQHYEAMRNKRVNIPRRTADYIILKALELEIKPPAPEPRP
jgi:hypothetical protein